MYLKSQKKIALLKVTDENSMIRIQIRIRIC
jgi:hypothetical protein